MNNKTGVDSTTPVHSPKVLLRHYTRESLVRMVQTNIQASHWAHSTILRAVDTYDPLYAELTTELAILNNNIAKGDYKLANEIPIGVSNSENMAYRNDWRAY